VKGCYLKPTTQTLKAASNGSSIPVLGEVTASFVTSKYRATVTGLVTKHVVEAMLGINWLYDNEAEWSFKEASTVLGGQRHDLLSTQVPGSGVDVLFCKVTSKCQHSLKSTYLVKLSFKRENRALLFSIMSSVQEASGSLKQRDLFM